MLPGYERKKDPFLAWIHSTGGNGATEKSGLINQELIHRNILRSGIILRMLCAFQRAFKK